MWNDATLAIRIGRRENTKSAVSYTSSSAPSASTGVAQTKASGRIHEIELAVTQSSGSLWTLAQGIDVTANADGKK